MSARFYRTSWLCPEARPKCRDRCWPVSLRRDTCQGCRASQGRRRKCTHRWGEPEEWSRTRSQSRLRQRLQCLRRARTRIARIARRWEKQTFAWRPELPWPLVSWLGAASRLARSKRACQRGSAWTWPRYRGGRQRRQGHKGCTWPPTRCFRSRTYWHAWRFVDVKILDENIRMLAASSTNPMQLRLGDQPKWGSGVAKPCWVGYCG